MKPPVRVSKNARRVFDLWDNLPRNTYLRPDAMCRPVWLPFRVVCDAVMELYKKNLLIPDDWISYNARVDYTAWTRRVIPEFQDHTETGRAPWEIYYISDNRLCMSTTLATSAIDAWENDKPNNPGAKFLGGVRTSIYD